jgi:stage II sporulation protein P
MGVTALSAVTATPLLSVDALLRDAVPALPSIAPVLTLPSKLPPALLETSPGLPGDHHRIWAQLGQKPLVGIYQTHSEEEFGHGPNGYSTVWGNTVVQVGWWLAQDLHGQGIHTAQARVDNMREGMLGSWSLSLQTARQLLRWYPSVRILLDVHRSRRPLSETVARVHGAETARILLVVGTSQLLPNPHWQENMELALKLARELKTIAPGILRAPGVDVAPYRYNQQLLPADVLVEVGGPANSLGQERRAVSYLAQAVAHLVRQHEVPGLRPRKG